MHKNSMNKAVLVGRIGNDPEQRATQSGRAISNFSVATNESYRDQSGQNIDSTEWHRCVAFGKTAEFINSYVRKGRLVYVEGRLKTRKWTDKNETTHYTTEILVDTTMLLDKRDDAPRSNDGGGIHYDNQARNKQEESVQDNYPASDDELPF